MENELKPCPFCGHYAVLWQDGGQAIYGHCPKCDASGQWFEDDDEGIGRQKAIDAWNTRV